MRFSLGKMTVSWDGDVVPCCFDYNKRYALAISTTRACWTSGTGEDARPAPEMMSNKGDQPTVRGLRVSVPRRRAVIPEATSPARTMTSKSCGLLPSSTPSFCTCGCCWTPTVPCSFRWAISI